MREDLKQTLEKCFPISFAGYRFTDLLGSGTFGIVFKGQSDDHGAVAIKSIQQDGRFKSREYEIHHQLRHPNIVKLLNAFTSRKQLLPIPVPDKQYFLFLEMEFMPETLHALIRRLWFKQKKSLLPSLTVKIYVFQMLRALAYMHNLGVAHRDIKPANLLLDPRTNILKLADLGSAKKLGDQVNMSYVASRYYRAPELCLGNTKYTTAIDQWAVGCVMAEMLSGQILFQGESNVDQFAAIVSILGSPSDEDLAAMRQAQDQWHFPEVKGVGLESVLKNRPPFTDGALELLTKLLTFDPAQRITAIEALEHRYFDELRYNLPASAPEGIALPPLMDFNPMECRYLPLSLVALRVTRPRTLTNVSVEDEDQSSTSHSSTPPRAFAKQRSSLSSPSVRRSISNQYLSPTSAGRSPKVDSRPSSFNSQASPLSFMSTDMDREEQMKVSKCGCM